jgi:hypothetical protein
MLEDISKRNANRAKMKHILAKGASEPTPGGTVTSYHGFLHCLEEVGPDWFIAENVEALGDDQGEQRVDSVL